MNHIIGCIGQMPRRQQAPVFVAALAAVLFTGLQPSCAMLANVNLPGAGSLTPPVVQFQGATLVQAPTQRALEAYYCPEVVPDPLGLQGGAAVLCRGLFGQRPPAATMAVAFDLRFKVSNPNHIPIPLADVLAAVTVFPGAGNRNLGATCVHLCAPGQPGCAGQSSQPGPPDSGGVGNCQASSRDVRSMSDFAGATANLLIATGVAAAAGQPLTFTAPQVSAGGDLDVTVRYSFGPEQLLGILRQIASQSVNELKAGRPVTFSIPFRIEGTVWFDGGSFGRIAVGYGPVDGTWVIPTEGLIAATSWGQPVLVIEEPT
jgi:hypothetical protein